MRLRLYILTFVLLVAPGCSWLKKASTTTEVNNYYKEYYRDSIITLPGEIVRTTLDSSAYELIKAQLQDRVKDTVIIRNTSSGVSMKYYLDALGRVTAECDKKDRQLQALIKTIDRAETSHEVKEVVRYKNNWQLLGVGAISATTILLILYLAKQRFKRYLNGS